MLRLIFLVLGTAAGLFYILMMLRGRKYEGLVASLDKETFSNRICAERALPCRR